MILNRLSIFNLRF